MDKNYGFSLDDLVSEYYTNHLMKTNKQTNKQKNSVSKPLQKIGKK
jgi:hypothetical protein